MAEKAEATVVFGVLNETSEHESRVALTPDIVTRLRKSGVTCLIESGAGVVIVAAHATSPLAWVFIFLAAVLGTMNVVGGYVVTDRMLEMFKSDKGKKKEEEAK